MGLQKLRYTYVPFSTPILIALQVQVNLDVVRGKVAFDIARNKTARL